MKGKKMDWSTVYTQFDLGFRYYTCGIITLRSLILSLTSTFQVHSELPIEYRSNESRIDWHMSYLEGPVRQPADDVRDDNSSNDVDDVTAGRVARYRKQSHTT